jgi:hypothetical protein
MKVGNPTSFECMRVQEQLTVSPEGQQLIPEAVIAGHTPVKHQHQSPP